MSKAHVSYVAQCGGFSWVRVTGECSMFVCMGVGMGSGMLFPCAWKIMLHMTNCFLL